MLKRIINLVHPADAPKQCKRDTKCHRFDGHADGCKTLGVVMFEKLEARVRKLFAGAS